LRVRLFEANIQDASLRSRLARGIDQQARYIDAQDETGIADATAKLERRLAATAADVKDMLAALNGRPIHRPAPERRDLTVDALMAFEPASSCRAVPLLDLLRVWS